VIVGDIFIIAGNDKNKSSKFWKYLHYWYLVPLILIFFKELYLMIDPIRGVIYDDTLIAIDRFIFGTDPTVELFKISNPILTEILQIVYGTFFFLPVILGGEFLLNKRMYELDYSTFIIVFGFVLSFIGYFLVPAIGPRFTLHNFSTNNQEMPGILITDFLREIVNSGESIPTGTLNPERIVQRDVFPSGHTQMTLLVMYLSVKFNSKLKYFFLINGTLLIFATVYLRYHYVIDLVGGAVFMLLTLWSGKKIYFWWINQKEVSGQLSN
jgi:membrane-associated phospholipid phosphatase